MRRTIAPCLTIFLTLTKFHLFSKKNDARSQLNPTRSPPCAKTFSLRPSRKLAPLTTWRRLFAPCPCRSSPLSFLTPTPPFPPRFLLSETVIRHTLLKQTLVKSPQPLAGLALTATTMVSSPQQIVSAQIALRIQPRKTPRSHGVWSDYIRRQTDSSEKNTFEIQHQ